ncbi:MAG: outer membrane protein assembly factor BamD [Bacteroidota bacterium]
MKNKVLVILMMSFLGMSQFACKSEYEKIRSSGDTALLLKKAFEYYEKEEWLKAQNLFELVIGAYKGRVEAEKAYFYYAYTHYHLGRYITAAYYFKNFANTFPNSQYREESDFMEGYSNFQLSPSFRLDQTYTEKSIEIFQLFVNTYPTSSRVEKCNNLIDEMRSKLERKAFDEGQLYYDLRQYQSATQSFENLLRDYPESARAEEVRYLITKASYNLAENSIYDKQSERYNISYKNAREFLERYPESDRKKEMNSIKENSDKKIKSIANVRY